MDIVNELHVGIYFTEPDIENDTDEKNDARIDVVIDVKNDEKNGKKTSSRMNKLNSTKPENIKKKVWTKTKTGLHGWKSARNASTSADISNIRTKIPSVKVNSTQQVFKSNFIKKWSLTATGKGRNGFSKRVKFFQK